MAHGAAWMAAFRLVERGFGIISTLVLARLLVPKDFGIVAMAMSVIAFIELINAFGFDNALIQRKDAERRHFDTAFSLNALLGLVCALLIVIAAKPAAAFYDEPRLFSVMLVLALATGVQGFENIGTVEFRKGLDFKREFYYLASKRLVLFSVSIGLAVWLRSYWAMVIGMLAGRAGAVLLSYAYHPFRPRWSLAGARDLMSFSVWLLVNNALYFLGSRAPHVIIGRVIGPSALGVYTVAFDVATLPTSELTAPINRVIFPAFSQIASDRTQLRLVLLDVLGATTFFAIPAAFGIAAVAQPLVLVCLGAKWTEAIPLLQILAYTGAATAVVGCAYPAYLALGVPRTPTLLSCLKIGLSIPAMIIAAKSAGLLGIAWVELTLTLMTVPMSFGILIRTLGLPATSVLLRVWRPILAAVSMYFVVQEMIAFMVDRGARVDQLPLLVVAVACGALWYGFAALGLWILAKRPHGTETRLLQLWRTRLERAPA